MAEITAGCDATVLNTGTPEGAGRWDLCRLCGALAAKDHQPVVLDPVGVGASAFRLAGVESLLEAFTPTLVRVNLGEAQALLHQRSRERGVDSADAEEKEHLAWRRGPGPKVSDHRAAHRGGRHRHRRRPGLAGPGRQPFHGPHHRAPGACSRPCAALSAPPKRTLQRRPWPPAASGRPVPPGGASAAALGPGHFHMALLDAAGTLTAAEAETLSAVEPLEL